QLVNQKAVLGLLAKRKVPVVYAIEKLLERAYFVFNTPLKIRNPILQVRLRGNEPSIFANESANENLERNSQAQN
ncbi:MAG TPA: hypothetical protein VJ044_03330, partial [Candidatus Hodarchaeales archaeon]|nr:hypothetical protein [Candidatus Hodarchaeales archaeon]